MAFFYTDTDAGSDANDGTSWANAKLTLEGMIAVMAAGDVGYFQGATAPSGDRPLTGAKALHDYTDENYGGTLSPDLNFGSLVSDYYTQLSVDPTKAQEGLNALGVGDLIFTLGNDIVPGSTTLKNKDHVAKQAGVDCPN